MNSIQSSTKNKNNSPTNPLHFLLFSKKRAHSRASSGCKKLALSGALQS